jgi:flagellar biosynthesis/type III secretory pathway chaperone
MTAKELEHLSMALEQAHLLKTLLEHEFSALKTQDLSAFDDLQPKKVDILSFLSSDQLAERVKGYSTNPKEASVHLSIWDDVMITVSECRDLHKRNEIFMLRKLESIKGALQTIQSPDPLNTVEVYDRLGKVRPNRSRGSMGKV